MEKLNLNPEVLNPKLLKSKNLELTNLQVRKVVEDANMFDPKWLEWHCKAVKRLGPTAYLQLADMAKTGRQPATLFTWLLKQELLRCNSAVA
jgi:hypothetical protein